MTGRHPIFVTTIEFVNGRRSRGEKMDNLIIKHGFIVHVRIDVPIHVP